ncbi:HAMP domain-containing sensor histidine kinase [Breznakia sp. PH5-24]|nr:HAMP domain-containing sensor histidine kinase [Breznakia sp. PH5-24]
MFIQLREVQNNLTYFYGLDVNINELSQGDYRFVDTYFFEKEADTFTVISNSNDLQEGSGIYTDIYKNIQVLSAISEGPVGTFYKNVSIDYSFSSKKYTYYSIKFLDDDVIMVSMLDNDYMEEFKSTFVGNVMDITIFVVGLFFVIMMLWVSNIIRPLNQIKNYIEKVKVGKDAKINVHRRDEIGEVATALVSMREELTRQESTKEEMIHNISHDLKTPIATIKSYGESIKDGIYPYDTLEKSVDVIIDNANRLEKKVHSLLFMNRVEYILSQDNEEVYCDMKEVVSTVVLNTKVIRPEIEIETNLTTSLFRGNDEAWRVCVENILENALRYAKSQIVITLDEDQLCIYNDGPQIEEERLKVLFKPYEKGEGGQFGLGLSIVSKVVQASHYQIVAENVETEGVIFKIMK